MGGTAEGQPLGSGGACGGAGGSGKESVGGEGMGGVPRVWFERRRDAMARLFAVGGMSDEVRLDSLTSFDPRYVCVCVCMCVCVCVCDMTCSFTCVCV